MLLRNKRTGFVYAYSKVLANDPEFEVHEETPVPEKHSEVVEVVTVPASKRKRRNVGESDGTHAKQPV
jgi:hypothetical protein